MWCDFPLFPNYMGVSENSGTSKSSILIGFSIINHPFWGTHIFGETPIWGFLKWWVSPTTNGFFPQKWSALGVWKGGLTPLKETPIYRVFFLGGGFPIGVHWDRGTSNYPLNLGKYLLKSKFYLADLNTMTDPWHTCIFTYKFIININHSCR